MRILTGFVYKARGLKSTNRACEACGLKAHCRNADWINKTIKKKRIR